jgi:hypothetical protein
LFSPNNGVYQYSAVVTDTTAWDPQELFCLSLAAAPRKNSFSELKTTFAFDHILTNSYQANLAFMQISQMAYNLATSMQHSMGPYNPPDG